LLAPCEVAVKCVLPVVRAMITKGLMTKHGLKQTDVATRLRISQSAVSLYSKKMRGYAIDLESEEDIVALVDDMAASLASGRMLPKDFITSLCEVCRVVRAKGLMCRLHKSFDPEVDIEECEVCFVGSLRCL